MHIIYVHVYIQYVPVVDVVPLISRVEDESAIPNAHYHVAAKLYLRTNVHMELYSI